MKAITRTQYGDPSVLKIEEIPEPNPSKGEIKVRVFCTTINRTDCGILTGKPLLIRAFVGLTGPRDRVPGIDFAGDIVEVGEGVETFKVGDRVWGLDDTGLSSQAEYMCIQETKAVQRIPEGISYADAVASAEGGFYAINFINKVSVTSTDAILVIGGTGTIGSTAIQLLKANGSEVDVVCGSGFEGKMKELGAKRVYNYEAGETENLSGPYAFIFDAVGKYSFGFAKPLLTPKGIYISSELGPGNENPFLALLSFIKPGKKVKFPVPVDKRGCMQEMNRLLKEDQFHPLIDREFSIEGVKEAYSYVASGEKKGNVILRFSNENGH